MKLKRVNRQTIVRLENGRVRDFSSETLRELGQLYGVAYEAVVGRVVEAKYGIELAEAQASVVHQPDRAAGLSNEDLDLARHVRAATSRQRWAIDKILDGDGPEEVPATHSDAGAPRFRVRRRTTSR